MVFIYTFADCFKPEYHHNITYIMHNWFECKVKYKVLDEQGREKQITEPYLIDALSFTEAEARIQEELRSFLGEGFLVANMTRAKYADIFFHDEGDRWYKSKITFISIDESKGVEKKSSCFMLTQADSLEKALETLHADLKEMASDFQVVAIQETPIMDIFPFDANAILPDNLKPLPKEDASAE